MNTQEQIYEQIKEQLQSHPVLLYMKGDRSFPQCGFSGRIVEILNNLGVQYETHDILEDPDLRKGLKTFSKWPTFPQLYVKGKLLGGCDIVVNMNTSGELQTLFTSEGLTSTK